MEKKDRWRQLEFHKKLALMNNVGSPIAPSGSKEGRGPVRPTTAYGLVSPPHQQKC